jgi:hypothetical protein
MLLNPSDELPTSSGMFKPRSGQAMFAKNRNREEVVAVGERYRKIDAPLIVWEVMQTFRGPDGVPYALLVSVGDRSQRKTVAQDALRRGSQYKRAS